MRRKIEDEFVRMQVWITDPRSRDVAARNWDRMGKQFRTNSIPLHAIVAPDDGRELARTTYSPTMSEADYLAFLDRGLAAFRNVK